MAQRTYYEIYLHIVWRIKDNSPVLKDEIEHQLLRFLRDRIGPDSHTHLHALAAPDDHLHLAVSIPPTLLISEWIGQLKGASSHFINHRVANRKLTEWQSGYGIVSFGKKDLPWIIKYLQNQLQHHAEQSTHPRLEKINPD